MITQNQDQEGRNDQLGLKALESVQHKLTDEIHGFKFDVICDDLASNKILGLTLEESKTIKMKYSEHGKATELIHSLLRTGHTDSDVVEFCKILFKEDQPKCGRILYDGNNFLLAFFTFCCFGVKSAIVARPYFPPPT